MHHRISFLAEVVPLMPMKFTTRHLLVVLLFTYLSSTYAQVSRYETSIKKYIDEYNDDAVREMHEDGIPASITLAQGIQESSAGTSKLAKHANNHFGIKCQKEWSGPIYIQDDDTKNECFRKYENVFDSYVDHSRFLKSRTRYTFLFQLQITDYKGWANGLKAAGYATDPLYAKKIIKIIEEHRLYNFDTIQPPSSELVASIDNYFDHPPKRNAYKLKEEPIKEVEEISIAKRKINLLNDRKYILAQQNESIDDISVQYDDDPRLIARYNDIKYKTEIKFKKGDIVFLQPKKNKGTAEFHIVKKGDTIHGISQLYGIKLKKLCKKNNIPTSATLTIGEKLWLRKNKPHN